MAFLSNEIIRRSIYIQSERVRKTIQEKLEEKQLANEENGV